MGLRDDLIYLAILLVSCALGLVSKKLTSYDRGKFNCLVGVSLVYLVCGNQILYSLGSLVLNLVFIYAVSNKHLHVVSMLGTFLYLSFTRTAVWFGLPALLPHANAVQLLMTLRCIGVCNEIEAIRIRQQQNPEASYRVPGFADIFCYAYNFVGLFTGPYYTYATHEDMRWGKGLDKIPVRAKVEPRLLSALVYIVGFLTVSSVFPLEAVNQPEFYECSLLWRLLYMVPTFVNLRLRVYVAWTLAEVACMFNALGAYPKSSRAKPGAGPTQPVPFRTAKDNHTSTLVSRVAPEWQFDVDAFDLVHQQQASPANNHRKHRGDDEWCFETIRNVVPYEVEFSRGYRSAMRAWNRSVQYWLAKYVYKRAPKSIRMQLTMTVSAIWHGFHYGYFISFLTVPLCTAAEDSILHLLSPVDRQSENGDTEADSPADLAWWFIKMRGIEYMAMGFLLLHGRETLRYMGSTYGILHIFMIGVLLYANFIDVDRSSTKKSTDAWKINDRKKLA